MLDAVFHRVARHSRGVIVIVALAVYAAASLGVLPSAALLSKWGLIPSSELAAFPCHDHTCGCLSADACWGGCCCYTGTERAAWIESHPRPLVPSWARAALAPATGASSTGSCCESRTAPPATGAVASALNCRGVNPWIFTGVPPSEFDRPLVIGGPVPTIPAPSFVDRLSPQSAIDASVPPPRA